MAPRHELRIGRDLAAMPGGVVYRNELIELIQYSATTSDVRKTPVVVIPPWINKYYVLDLTPQQSLLGHLVNAGYTVFVVSWKNPGASLAGASFADYLMRGVRQAIEVARGICGVPSVHAVGYCVGGTALAALMAWLNAGRGGRAPVAHWTLLATLVDFSEPGPIAAFVNEESVETICALMAQRGYLDGRQLELTFRMLRANSLIWHYVVHNYLYGETPPPSAVLQWNMDTTRVPAAMHGWYLRECYLENKLRRANALTVDGRGIDVGRIRQPLYAVGSEEDHITPWLSTFATTQLVGGPVRYTLTTSGHILGIVNPPVTPPRCAYWSGEARAESAAAWRARQTAVAGSWWTDWTAWLGEHCVERVAPRAVGTAAYPCLAPAPGTYVHEL
jgi:polyhydroxyalkanoate synthase